MLNFKKRKVLVTHDGSFHADDVFACATLMILLEKREGKIEIIRTRDEQKIKSGDYVFDVGGIYNPSRNRFDHHQAKFSKKRKNKIPYSSFGLIWEKYGADITGNKEIKKILEKTLVEQIDAYDNGFNLFKPLTEHEYNYDISSAVNSFQNFKKAVVFAKGVIISEIAKSRIIKQTKELVEQARAKAKDPGIVVLNKEIPRHIVEVATTGHKKLIFVIFRNEKNWKAMAVRKKIGVFENKKSLPKNWAGLRDEELARVSGVSDAVFCHRGLFMVVAKSKEGAIALAQRALKANEATS